jgi:hypothetical protein
MPNDLQKQIDQLKADLEALNAEYYTNNFTASQDFNKYSRFNTRIKVPTLSAAPSTCEIGELCVVSSTGKLYVCSAANTWTIAGTQS